MTREITVFWSLFISSEITYILLWWIFAAFNGSTTNSIKTVRSFVVILRKLLYYFNSLKRLHITCATYMCVIFQHKFGYLSVIFFFFLELYYKTSKQVFQIYHFARHWTQHDFKEILFKRSNIKFFNVYSCAFLRSSDAHGTHALRWH